MTLSDEHYNTAKQQENKNRNATTAMVNPQKIKLVTKLLIDNKFGLMDDLNFSRPLTASSEGVPISTKTSEMGMEYLKNRQENSVSPLPPIPRSTRIKADRVRIYLDYYYSILERCISIDNSQNHHEGVEGVYNPLQVIRNRKLKKKHHELPTREFYTTKHPVIAIKQFTHKTNRKMPWFVDINEKYMDLTWRTSHWEELTDPQGKLWFQFSSPSTESSGSSSSRQHHKRHRSRLRHHSRAPTASSNTILLHSNTQSLASKRAVTNEETNNSNNTTVKKILTTPEAQISKNRRSDPNFNHIRLEVPITNTITNNSSDQGSLILEVKGSSGRGNTRRGSNNTSGSGGNKSSKHYRSISASSSENEKSRLNGLEKIISKTSKGWARSPKKNTPTLEKQVLLTPVISNGGTSRRSSNNGASISTSSSKSSVGITFGNGESYKTPMDNGKDVLKRQSLLSEVPVHTLRGKNSTNSLLNENEQVLESDHESPSGADKIYDGVSREKTASDGSENAGMVSDSLQVDGQLQKYWHDTRYIMSTVAMMQHRRETHDIVKRREIVRRNQIEISQDVDTNIKKTSEALAEYDNELNKVLKLGNDWTSRLLNDYSIRVETLISSSDRILSDINTTLTLKLKLFQENTERYVTVKVMRAQKMTKTIYGLLEFGIVIVLWTIWFFFSILRSIRFSIILVLKMIKALIW
ncbi:Maintenance of telomere capping protein 4 [Saccharomyces pastorianus]|uniref:Maintenance of telomere capping protein 4 n=1 Tax=Saccharomyces pastorianus TaxID=27292 RepID=A0A6C1E659_SACPS|nr:Maintenance of telomere capping protein 4 [Saccharomyces pastorianus]